MSGTGRCCHCVDTKIWELHYAAVSSSLELVSSNDESWPTTEDLNGFLNSSVGHAQVSKSFGRGVSGGPSATSVWPGSYSEAYTRERMLKDYGVHNVLVLGCPIATATRSIATYTGMTGQSAFESALMRNVGTGLFPLPESRMYEQAIDHLKHGHDVVMFLPNIPYEISGQFGEFGYGGSGGPNAYWMRGVAPQSMWDRVNRCLAGLGSGTRVQAADSNDWNDYSIVHRRHQHRFGLIHEYNSQSSMDYTFQGDGANIANMQHAIDNSLIDVDFPWVGVGPSDQAMFDRVFPVQAENQMYEFTVPNADSTGTNQNSRTVILANSNPTTHLGYLSFAREWFSSQPSGTTSEINRTVNNTSGETHHSTNSFTTYVYDPGSSTRYHRNAHTNVNSFGGIGVDPKEERYLDSDDRRQSPYATVERIFGGRLIVLHNTHHVALPITSTTGDEHTVMESVNTDVMPLNAQRVTYADRGVTNGANDDDPGIIQVPREGISGFGDMAHYWEVEDSEVTVDYIGTNTSGVQVMVLGTNQWCYRAKSASEDYWRGPVLEPRHYDLTIGSAPSPGPGPEEEEEPPGGSDPSSPSDIVFEAIHGKVRLHSLPIMQVNDQTYNVGGTDYDGYSLSFDQNALAYNQRAAITDVVGSDVEPGVSDTTEVFSSKIRPEQMPDALVSVMNPFYSLQSSGPAEEHKEIILVKDNGTATSADDLFSIRPFSVESSEKTRVIDNNVKCRTVVELLQDGVRFRCDAWTDYDHYEGNNASYFDGDPVGYQRRDLGYGRYARLDEFIADDDSTPDFSAEADELFFVVRSTIAGEDLEWDTVYHMIDNANYVYLSFQNSEVQLSNLYGYDNSQDWVRNGPSSPFANVLHLEMSTSYSSFADGQVVTLTFDIDNYGEYIVSDIDLTLTPSPDSDNSPVSIVKKTSGQIIATYTITSADETAGNVLFEASVSGTYLGQTAVSKSWNPACFNGEPFRRLFDFSFIDSPRFGSASLRAERAPKPTGYRDTIERRDPFNR